jgi:hypothetical protein
MYMLRVHRGFILAASFAIAGCGGTTTPWSLTGSSGHPASQVSVPSLLEPIGKPLAPLGARRSALHPIHLTYPTRETLVFEADQNEGAINIYKACALSTNPAPIATIVSGGCPYGLAMDKKGTLYEAIVSCGGVGNTVEEYPKGRTQPSATITDGLNTPVGLAIDSSGTLYVWNNGYPGPASITEYPYGSTTPSVVITGGGLQGLSGCALDKSGNLYVTDNSAAQVFEIPAGTTNVFSLNLQQLPNPTFDAIDYSTGDLWVTDGPQGSVNVYAPGSQSPRKIIPGFTTAFAISIENKQRVFGHGGAVISDLGASPKAVDVFKRRQYTPYATLTNGIEFPSGLLITKP